MRSPHIVISADAKYCTVEFATLKLDETTKQPVAKIYRPSDVDALLAKQGIGKKDGDVETN